MKHNVRKILSSPANYKQCSCCEYFNYLNGHSIDFKDEVVKKEYSIFHRGTILTRITTRMALLIK